ncbi:ATPase/DNA packaging protein [Silvimonas sp.]|uniref:ATPase/DNA packaging protein n=1 Tax=Silvimonas sp. TaxID=2650811 RepID=UPI002845B089|nr:ATPase/DNA packaging protein [Silvimonas sp.]MDR3426054.1 ATPase/DNA packaging protein [Silvimonas sp.]
MPLTSRVTILGPSGSGKSNFLRSFLFERRNEIHTAVVFSGSEGANAQWEAIFPRAYIYNELDVNALERILQRQTDVTQNAPDPKTGNQVSLIFDDLPEADLRLPIMTKLFTKGRHYGIGIFVLIQFATMVPPAIRSNSNYVIVTQTQGEDREKVYKTYFKILGSMERFNLVMDHFCRNFGQLVFIKQAKAPTVEESVKWIRSKVITEPFTVGSREYWALDELFTLPPSTRVVDWDKVRKSLAQGRASATQTHLAVESTPELAACEMLDKHGRPMVEANQSVISARA